MGTAYSDSGQARQFSGSPIAVSLTGVPAGAALMAFVYWNNAASTLLTLSDGTNSFIVPANTSNVAGALGAGSAGYLLNSAGGSVTVTATFGAASFSMMALISATGVAITSGLDTSNAVAATLGGGTDNVIVPLTLGSSGDFIAATDFNGGQNGAVTAGTGYAQRQQFAGNNGAAESLDNFVGTGSNNVTFTDGSFDQHLTFALALKVLASSATLKTVNGLVADSIKTAQGLAKASVKTYDGLTP